MNQRICERLCRFKASRHLSIGVDSKNNIYTPGMVYIIYRKKKIFYSLFMTIMWSSTIFILSSTVLGSLVVRACYLEMTLKKDDYKIFNWNPKLRDQLLWFATSKEHMIYCQGTFACLRNKDLEVVPDASIWKPQGVPQTIGFEGFYRTALK